jgi:hypothetical protein
MSRSQFSADIELFEVGHPLVTKLSTVSSPVGLDHPQEQFAVAEGVFYLSQPSSKQGIIAFQGLEISLAACSLFITIDRCSTKRLKQHLIDRRRPLPRRCPVRTALCQEQVRGPLCDKKEA